MSAYTVDLDWLKRVREDIIDPGQRIIDPHHHLWPKTVAGSSNVRRPRLYNYMLEDFWEDTSSGHNVTDSVYIECSEFFWNSENEHFNPVGETEYIKGLAQLSLENSKKTTISGIIGHANMLLGKDVDEFLERHLDKNWKKDLKELSQYKNVFAKLGGLAMPINGLGFEANPNPPTSDQFMALQRQFYLTTIDFFGSERCMFESNFPVDKYSVSYQVLWNSFKNLVKDFSETDKNNLFFKTASNVYSIP